VRVDPSDFRLGSRGSSAHGDAKRRFEEVREAHPTELPKKATKLDFHCLINAPSITAARDSGQPRCETQHNQWMMGKTTELFFNLIRMA